MGCSERLMLQRFDLWVQWGAPDNQNDNKYAVMLESSTTSKFSPRATAAICFSNLSSTTSKTACASATTVSIPECIFKARSVLPDHCKLHREFNYGSLMNMYVFSLSTLGLWYERTTAKSNQLTGASESAYSQLFLPGKYNFSLTQCKLAQVRCDSHCCWDWALLCCFKL